MSDKDLKSLLSSTLRRQHLLGTTPGAQRLIPLAAFAAGDLFARRSGGDNVVEGLLCGNDEAQIALSAPAPSGANAEVVKGSGDVTVEVCRACSRQYPGILAGSELSIGLMYGSRLMPWMLKSSSGSTSKVGLESGGAPVQTQRP